MRVFLSSLLLLVLALPASAQRFGGRVFVTNTGAAGVAGVAGVAGATGATGVSGGAFGRFGGAIGRFPGRFFFPRTVVIPGAGYGLGIYGGAAASYFPGAYPAASYGYPSASFAPQYAGYGCCGSYVPPAAPVCPPAAPVYTPPMAPACDVPAAPVYAPSCAPVAAPICGASFAPGYAPAFAYGGYGAAFAPAIYRSAVVLRTPFFRAFRHPVVTVASRFPVVRVGRAFVGSRVFAPKAVVRTRAVALRR